jgi:hypothetical protein
MNLFSDSPFFLGFPSALDLAFSRRHTEAITIWLREPADKPSRLEMQRLLPSFDENTSVHFELGHEPEFELTVDTQLVDSRGVIRDASRTLLSISSDEARSLALECLRPLPSMDAALRAIFCLKHYPELIVADDLRAWLLATDTYLSQRASRLPDVALYRLRYGLSTLES